MTTVVGVISDTHGLLRPEALTVLQGCDAIVHGGDIGKREVLDELREIAPVTAIRGNIDTWATDMPDSDVIEVESRRLFIVHDVNELNIDPRAAGFDMVISGHSHKPKVIEVDGVLFLNPGSAGPRRFSLPVTLALLTIAAERIEPRIVELDV